jgi:predicted transcriptional regulator
MRSRSKYDIYLDILRTTSHNTEGSTLGFVIKGASLNSQQAKEIVIYLLEIGMLQFNSNKKTLRTTRKGWRFMDLYESLNGYFVFLRKISQACFILDSKKGRGLSLNP